ncbi:MAG: hypothetical protein NTY50_18970 [Methylobacter sp.]|nr:hypothetical protein [Methylobacter sp.]
MTLLKKSAIALFIGTAFLATAPTAMAKPAGKIENQTPEGVKAAFDEAIAAAEAADAALQALTPGANNDAVLELMKEAKQALNHIESATVNREKERANGFLKDARGALIKGDLTASKASMTAAVEKFKELKKIYLSF